MAVRDELLQHDRDLIQANLASGASYDAVHIGLNRVEGRITGGSQAHEWDQATAMRVAELRLVHGEVGLAELGNPRLVNPNTAAETARRAALADRIGSIAVRGMVQVGADLGRTSASAGRRRVQGRRDRRIAHYFQAGGNELLARVSTLELAEAARTAYPRVPALRSAVSGGRAAYETAYVHARHVHGAAGAMARAEIATLAARHERVGRLVAFGRFHQTIGERVGTTFERVQSRFSSVRWGARRLMASARVMFNPEARRATHRANLQYNRGRDPRDAVVRHP